MKIRKQMQRRTCKVLSHWAGDARRAKAFRTKHYVKFRVAITATARIQDKAECEHTGNTQSSTYPRLYQIAGACNKEAPNSCFPVPSAKIAS